MRHIVLIQHQFYRWAYCACIIFCENIPSLQNSRMWCIYLVDSDVIRVIYKDWRVVVNICDDNFHGDVQLNNQYNINLDFRAAESDKRTKNEIINQRLKGFWWLNDSNSFNLYSIPPTTDWNQSLFRETMIKHILHLKDAWLNTSVWDRCRFSHSVMVPFAWKVF